MASGASPRPPPGAAVPVLAGRIVPNLRNAPVIAPNASPAQATKRPAASQLDDAGPFLKTSPPRRSAFSLPTIVAPPRGVAASLEYSMTIASVTSGHYKLEPNVMLIMSNRRRSHCPDPDYDKSFVLDAFLFNKTSTLNELRDVFAFGNHKWIDVQIALFDTSHCTAAPGSPLTNGTATLAELGFETVQRIDVELPYDYRRATSVEFAIQDFNDTTRTGHAPVDFTLEKIMSWALGETALMSCRTRLFAADGSTWNMETAAKTQIGKLAIPISGERMLPRERMRVPTLRSAYYAGRTFSPEVFDHLFYFTTVYSLQTDPDYFFAVAADPSASWNEVVTSITSAVGQGRVNAALNQCLVMRTHTAQTMELLNNPEVDRITIDGQPAYFGNSDGPRCFTVASEGKPAAKQRNLDSIAIVGLRTRPCVSPPACQRLVG